MRFKRIWAMLLIALLAAGIYLPALAEEEYNMPYYITVDLTNQIVTVYKTKDDSIARQMLCSTGKNDSTPEGTFYLPENGRLSERSDWTYFEEYACWVKYATRIYYGYMFHSLPFAKKDNSTMKEEAAMELGLPASHGCIRLRVEDARFIAQNCLIGTRVRIYKEDEKEDELRQLLSLSSYSSADGMSYSEFLGYSENDLGRGSGGTEVADLQHRLTALGYFEGEISGNYGADMVAAVKHVQADLGMAQSGVTSEELSKLLYSEDAPVSAGEITLREGHNGPVVKKLQGALAELGVYDGEMDSVYDLDVADAVRRFQGACNSKEDGIATPELQQALYYELAKLEETFGADAKPTVDIETEDIVKATVHTSAKIIIRAKADTKSESLGKLSDGDAVVVDGSHGDWAGITVGTVSGYVLKKYLEPYAHENVILHYSDANGHSYSIGHTLAEYKAGAQSVADEFSAYYLNEQFTPSSSETVRYATVSTGSDSVKLNLRATAGSDGAILAEIPNGTDMRVLGDADGWTQVGYGNEIGYLLNDYLEFWESDAEEVENMQPEEDESYVPEIEEGSTIKAVVICGSEEKAPVYESGSLDAKRLGSLTEGIRLEVVSVNEDDDWVLVRYKDHEGYMQDSYLQFQLM